MIFCVFTSYNGDHLYCLRFRCKLMIAENTLEILQTRFARLLAECSSQQAKVKQRLTKVEQHTLRTVVKRRATIG
jgi:hypothetical protein